MKSSILTILIIVLITLSFIFYSNKTDEKSINIDKSETTVLTGKQDLGLQPEAKIVKTYFDDEFEITHNKSDASYYRIAKFINGLIDTTSIVYDYYISGEIQFEGYILSENPDVHYKSARWYYRSGELDSEMLFDANGNISVQLEYYVEGGLKVYTKIIDGYDNYNCERYFINTDIISDKYQYRKGKLHNKHYWYYHDGRIKSEGEYSYGKRSGISVGYYNDGTLKFRRVYKNDKLNGEYIGYFPNGQIKAKGNYKDDKQTEYWTYYNNDGSSDVYEYIDDKPNLLQRIGKPQKENKQYQTNLYYYEDNIDIASYSNMNNTDNNSYTYDISGYIDGEYFYGDIEADSNGGEGYIYDNNGNSNYMNLEWSGFGTLEGYDDDGNYYEFETN